MRFFILVAFYLILCFGSSALEEIAPLVINGVRSPVAPYFAFIQYYNVQGLEFFGGGALISNRHILTAASNVHGYDKKQLFVNFATH